jgi:hypothetical protein
MIERSTLDADTGIGEVFEKFDDITDGDSASLEQRNASDTGVQIVLILNGEV